MKFKHMAIAAVLIAVAGLVSAHGGGLNKDGCHNEKQGKYHCHGKSPSSVKPTTQTKYNRDSWKHWSDFDNDCMNTRHEILLAQADGPVKKSPDGCYISSSTWNDPFSGKTLLQASDLDVDHIIPLKWASEHGGLKWSSTKKERFANDPVNLLAVDDSLNQSKGARGPTQWMPPNHSFRCKYLGLWQVVLSKYTDLKMTSKENRTFNKQLNACK
jgi:Domain of unknown function (DUF1994).